MTPDEYAIHFCNNNDVPFATDGKKYRALVNVIAQAVADEREACAKICDAEARWINNPCAADDCAAAIRARST